MEARAARKWGAAQVRHRIRLINGQRHAASMIQYGVGVRARITYVINTVDEDYFSEVCHPVRSQSCHP